MLRISKLADYGTVLMTYMAKHPDEPHTAKTIAAHTQITLPMASKILKLLTQAGLLASARGAQGGYSMAREPHYINVVEIIAALDGNIALTDCSSAVSECSLELICAIRNNWRLINQVVYDALETISLADLADEKQRLKHAHDRILKNKRIHSQSSEFT
ncbi:MAG: system Fe-S cluster assembly regulator [Gammaproteobacteria bacterium]|jgi:FeS assembly SUF system regulator|nr:system Fe-S cluster assembly regulator [Gammaproteobacteria bacterium]